ncbi:MAG: helix-turn-helix domain-containing protein [Lentisphaerae bacterium]|mgnify:FL=1|jgi:DNA-binding IclR family transcriptional regulator|nr:helix-turn-helix domain-containing protein [Lentisphaerota bacterium]MBT4823154.1 helix-turn-helix domain-containing protein [Lentisphaerota bacterium]MBT5610458.1 helix-turn-helix domain-containing protein [Lentisphaerota bacterium]MBT7061049.1 helix-turn-helix domain-containing protein [Lentisphaerota bacterium]MBT7842166.1 helix-turn-helix domain-containing protein [Lentisphaerota bacterium]
MIQVVKRTFSVLAVLHEEQPLPLREIALRTGLRKTTLCNILKTLENLGVLTGSRGGFYELGPQLARLASNEPDVERLTKLVLPHVERLSSALCEPVIAANLADTCVRVIASAKPERGLLVGDTVVRSACPFEWATGRLLVAFASSARRSRLVDRLGLPEERWSQVRSLEDLEAQCAAIRQQGWAERLSDDGEIQSLAAPVRVPDGRTIAALGVYLPKLRCAGRRRREVLDLLQEEAKATSDTCSIDRGVA